MFRVLTCITTQHDARLVLLAVLICAAAVYTAFHTYAHAAKEQGWRLLGWVLLTGASTGVGIWATHFVAMLGYRPDFPIVYSAPLTIASLLAAVIVVTAGFALATRNTRSTVAAGGAVIGTGIGLMHLMGTRALMVAGTLQRDVPLIVAALVIGVGLAAAALLAWRELEGRRAIWVSAGLLALAICGLHFTAMAAVTILPDPTVVVRGATMDSQTLGLVVAGVAFLVLLAALGGVHIKQVYAARDLAERHRAEKMLRRQHLALQQREAELRTQNQRFELTLALMTQGLCLIDADRRFVVCNKSYADIYNLPPDLVKPGARLADMMADCVARGIYAPDEVEQYRRERATDTPEPSVRIRRLADGRIIRIDRRPANDGGWISVHEDITERERLNAQLEAQNTLLRRQEADLKAQNANLDMALSNMSQGLAMFDAEERLVLANARYAEIYGLEPAQVRPGTTLRETIVHRIAGGLYPGLSADAVLANMRGRIARKHANQLISRPGDGRVLSVSIHPRDDGGWVVTLHDITEREELNARLTEQNALLQEHEIEIQAQNTRFNTAIGAMSQGMCLYDADQRVVFANQRFTDLYGLTAEQVKRGTTLVDVLQARVNNGLFDTENRSEFIDRSVSRFHRFATEIVSLSDGRFISVVRRPTADGGLLSTHEDITERQLLNDRLEQKNKLLNEQEEKVRTQNLRLDAALNNMVQGLAMYDDQLRLLICNDRYREMYGLTTAQVEPGTPLRDIIEHRIAQGEFRGKSADELVAGMIDQVGGQKAAQYISHLADGRHIAVSVQRMADGGTVTTHHDITEQRRTEARIAHMALHDTLTGLPNRVLFNERLDHALKRSKRGEIVATHLLDLDNFKIVNDTMGHPAGDELLKQVADRLRALARETDTVARMGGDEFAIVQAAILQPSDATALAHRVIEAVSAPYQIEDQQVVIGTSVGIAIGPSDGLTTDQLVRNADLALYRAKSDGRGTYRFFEREMDKQMQVRRSIEHDLRLALPAGEFELHYQPIVNLASNAVCGFEALMRWRHPEKGLVPPDTFIPLAEEIGFIVPLGEWAIREACATAATWPGALKVAVNLSAVQFRTPGLVQIVVSALASSGLPAERLELEITETILLQDSDATLSTLYQLRALGVHIAMDDFGTGYSSLSYLQSFPFDKIKIDRSFITDIADGIGSRNIVRAVAAMANGLGMATTAEGVETQEQLDSVRAEGCTEMQGFVFSKAMPAHEIGPFLRAQTAGKPSRVAVDAA